MTDRASETTDEKKPRRSGSQKRQRGGRVILFVNDSERAEVEARAEKAGLSVSGYLRVLALGKDAPQPKAARRVKLTADMEQLRETLYQLQKIGANLNQIAHHLNRGEETPPEIVATALADHIAAARAILHALEGKAA